MKQQWLKCDMHMHSYYSKSKDKTRVKQMSAKDYVDALLDKGINIFSITDHDVYSSSYYDDIRKYIIDKPIEIINGTELDVYVNDKDFFQMGVYFDNNLDGNRLEKILNDLYKNDNKPKFHEIINCIVQLKCKIILVPEGNKARGILSILDKISIEESNDINKYAMYKIFSAFDVTASFNERSCDNWALGFYEQTQAFEKNLKDKSEKEKKFIISEIRKKINDKKYEIADKDCKKIYDYIINYGNYFSYFKFSDWHNAEPYNPQIYNYIFGSLEYFFETFELAVLDPQSRIIKSAEEQIPIPPNIISSISFELNGKNKDINFSPGLNVIIGKRGSGKSLLLAIIENLNKSNNKITTDYKNFNIKNVLGIDYNGIKINPGQLSSLAVLEQDKISEIYKNPDIANKQISSYFPKIDDYDLSYINQIIDIAKNVKPIDINYKNITSILKILNDKTDYYTYDTYAEISSDSVSIKINSLSKSLNELVKEFENYGLNIDELKNINSTIIEKYSEYKFLLDKYSEVVKNSNERTNKIISERDESKKIIQEQRKNLNSIINIIKRNFKIILDSKKLNYLLDNFKQESPVIKKYVKMPYLFTTSYEVPDNLIDTIYEKIASTISKVKSDSSDFSLIMKYINGERNLKANINSLSAELSKFIQNEIFQPKKEFFKINSKINIDDIKVKKDLFEQIDKRTITDLSKESPGMKSVAYLDMLFELNELILLFDQPEDNIDNDYISQKLVSIIKEKKKIKQLIFVTHNPTVAVYGDAFNYIFVTNDGEIDYKNYLIESQDDKEEIMNILDGGRKSFSNRNKKYGNVLGEEEYGNN